MEADGVDWRSVNPAGYIAVNEITARTIARVMPAGREQVRTCLSNMKLYNRLVMPGGPVKNALAESVLRLSGKWEPLGELLIVTLDRPAYAASCAELERLAEGAVPVALELMDNYCAHVFQGAPLSSRFDRTYGPVPEWMERYAAENR